MESRFREILVMMARYADELHEPVRSIPKRSRLKHFLRMKDPLPELSRLEQVLGIGNWLYEMVRLVEHNWRTEVLNGKTLYDPREDESIMDLYRQWELPCQRCVDGIKYFVSKRFKVQGGDKFQSYCMEAKNTLSGHNPFFDDVDNADHWAKVTAFLFPRPRPVRMDAEGRIFEMSGEQLVVPGLDQERVLKVREEMRDGQRRTLKEATESRNHNCIRDISPSGSREGT